jgi:hypothetical protein
MPDERGQWEHTPLGKILRVAGFGEEAMTRGVVAPLLGQLDPEAAARLPQGGPMYMGDVLNAVVPPGEFPTPLEKGARAVGGMVLGGLVDPTARLGAAARILKPTMVGRAAAQAGRAIQVGKAAEAVLSKVQLPQVGRFLDHYTTAVSQKFGFNVGADPWLMRSHQELFSAITGAQKMRVERVVDELEPMLQKSAQRFAARLNMPPEIAYQKLKAAVTEATDMHPYIEQARNAQGVLEGFRAGKVRSPYEQARQAVINNFGLPATFGGPAAASDTDLIRQVRQAVLQRNHTNKELLIADEARLGHDLALHTHPDAGYSAGVLSSDARQWITREQERLMQGTVIGGAKRARRSYTTPPTEHMGHEIARTMRVLDPAVFQDFTTNGVLKPITLRGTRNGREVIRRVDPTKYLAPLAGQPLTRSALRLVEKLADSGVLSYDREATNYVGRLIPSMSTADKNTWIWEKGWGKFVRPGEIKQFFETDPTVIDAARGMASDRAMLSKEWFDAVKRHGIAPGQSRLVAPVDTPDVPADWIEVKGIPELHGYAMEPGAARFLKQYYEADLNVGPHLRKFMSILGTANQAFKSWTLSIFPAYHSRNFVGSMWNYYLGSENPAQAARDLLASKSAWDAIRRGKQAKGWKLRGAVNSATGAEWSADEVWREVQKRNGWGVGFVSADPKELARHVEYAKRYGVDDPGLELLRGAKEDWKANGRRGRPFIGPPSPTIAEKIKLGFVGQHPWVERGFRIASYTDDRIRMAHVLQRLRAGDSMDDAVRSMKKHFFDYHQLTPMERQIREALPFYAWSRKNIPYQLEMLVRRPDRIARFHDALQTWEGSEQVPPEEKYMNEWMKKNFSVRIRKNRNGKYEYFAFKNWLPLIDIAELFHSLEWLTQNLTPWARVPIELMSNYNWFTDRKIDHLNSLAYGERTRYGTLGKRFRGVAVPNKVAHVINSVRLTNTLHQVLDNPQELDFMSQLLRVVAGRTYPLDAGRSAYQWRRQIEDLERSARQAARSAIHAGNEEDVNRIVETYLKQREAAFRSRGMRTTQRSS